MVVADATFLALLVNPAASPPTDPATGAPLERARERVELLISQIERDKGTIIVPTPALAEVLVRADDGAPAILERFNRSARFKIADFDQRAAVELAAMTRDALRAGDKFDGVTAPWQKVKIDRQIVAIARVNNAKAIYSDDSGLATFAAKLGIPVIRTWELPLPEAPPPDLFATLEPAPADDPDTEG